MKVASECAAILARQAETVCRQLLPNGKSKQGRYYAGSTGGEQGESLVVELKGGKVGIWSDFASGEAGDLVDLWAAVNGKPIRAVLGDIARWCNVDTPQVGQVKRYKKPNIPKGRAECPDNIIQWFKDRGIEKETIDKNNVRWIGNSIAYPCYNGDKVALIRYRDTEAPKNERFKSSKDSRPTMFGWPLIKDKARYVFITEGFEDCMILQQWDLPVLSVPFGAGSGAKQQWIETEHDNLLQFDNVVLCMDADQAGEAAIKEICERLGQHRVRVLRLGGMDVTDWWRKGGNKERFVELAKEAKHLDLDVVKNLSHFQDKAIEFITGGGFRAAEAAFEFPFKDMEDWRLLDGTVTCITGSRATGKTGWTTFMSIFAGIQGYKCLIASMELSGEQTAVKFGHMISGSVNPTKEYLTRCFEFASDMVYIYNVVDNTKYKKLLEAMEYSFKRHGTKLFIIDSLLKLGIPESDSDQLVEAINDFGRFAKKYNCQVWVIAHQIKLENKMTGIMSKPTADGIRGTGQAADLFDTIIGIHRVKPNIDQPHLPNLQILPLKYRFSENAPEQPINFWLDKQTNRYYRDSRRTMKDFVSMDGSSDVIEGKYTVDSDDNHAEFEEDNAEFE